MINSILINALDGLKTLNLILCVRFSPTLEILRVMFEDREVLK